LRRSTEREQEEEKAAENGTPGTETSFHLKAVSDLHTTSASENPS
jgi:hypothetical protein